MELLLETETSNLEQISKPLLEFRYYTKRLKNLLSENRYVDFGISAPAVILDYAVKLEFLLKEIISDGSVIEDKLSRARMIRMRLRHLNMRLRQVH
jgi:hypothetical protein